MPVCSTTVDLPQDKRKVVRVRRRWRWRWRFWAKSLYVGIKNEIPPPPQREQFIQNEWDKVIREELRLHLDKINREIQYACRGKDTWTSILEPELLLTGYQIGKSISLSPLIWFRCGSSWVENIVRKETGALSWMAERGLGDRIETGLKSAILVSNASSTPPRQLQNMLDNGLQPTSNLPYGYTLHICTEKLRVASTENGILCSVSVMRDGHLEYHSVCRIGGLITIKDGSKQKIFAVTTAHGLLDYFLNTDSVSEATRSVQPQLQSRTRLIELASSLVGKRHDPSTVHKAASAIPSASTATYGALTQHELDAVEWEPVRSVSSTNWLGGGWEIGKEFQHPFFVPCLERLVPDADFALLELSSKSYHESQRTRQDSDIVPEIKTCLSDSALHSGPVQVILRSAQQGSEAGWVVAQLLYERPHLFLRGAPFPTRKLRLEKPLASGTSGAWVVRGHELCGMIVASYETEPYAHMITAEKLFSDIEKTLDIMPGQITLHQSSLNDFLVDAPHIEPIKHHEDTNPFRRTSSLPSNDFIKAVPARYAQRNKGSDVPADNVIDKLQKDLNEALVISAARESVLMSLSQTFKVSTKADQLLDYIFNGDKPSLKIYGILVLIGKVEEIESFANSGITDQDLPIPTTVNDFQKNNVGPSPSDDAREKDTKLAFFTNWNYSEFDLLNVYQWYFLSPRFSQNAEGRILHYALQDNVVLPWIEMDAKGTAGGYSVVSKVKIHPESHEFPCGDEPDVFALRHFISENPDSFAEEIKVLQSLPRDNQHIVQPLATFKHRNSFYVILPWASGGSLYDLWQQYQVGPPLYVALPWFIDQAYTLAQGLCAIHRPCKGLSIVHGDLKPDNILIFRQGVREGKIGGSLKFTDFGAAYQTDANTPNLHEHRFFSPTYRAPETEWNRRISPEYDIWALGCTYLECICWLFLGHKGVQDFTYSRVLEEGRLFTSLNSREANFFRPVTKRHAQNSDQSPSSIDFVVKDCVIELISELKGHPACPIYFKDLLDLIQEGMLVVEQSRRMSAKIIAETLVLIKWRAGLQGQHEDQQGLDGATFGEVIKPDGSQRALMFDGPVVDGSKRHDATSTNTNNVDIKTIDEFVKETTKEIEIAETTNQKKTQRVTFRWTVEYRYLWNLPDPIREKAIQGDGKRYTAYKSKFSQMTREDLISMEKDLYTRISAVDSLLREQQRGVDETTQGTLEVKEEHQEPSSKFHERNLMISETASLNHQLRK